jgi:CRP-like cAMP-binding protein
VKKALELLAKRHALVPGFSPETLTPLQTLPVQRRILTRGEAVTRGGSRFDGMFLIEEGWISLHTELENGTNQVLAFLLPGQFVALGALAYSSAAWSFTAISRAVLLRFDPQAVNALLDQHARLSKLVMWIAVTQLRYMGERLADVGRRSAYERTGRLLLELWSRLHAVDLAEADGYLLPAGQKLVADALGLTDAHLNRTLRHLKDDGLISIEQEPLRRVRILDPAAAVRKLGFDTAQFKLPGFD